MTESTRKVDQSTCKSVEARKYMMVPTFKKTELCNTGIFQLTVMAQVSAESRTLISYRCCRVLYDQTGLYGSQLSFSYLKIMSSQ